MICYTCKQEKGDKFWKNKYSKTGYRSNCADCSKAYNKKFYCSEKATTYAKKWAKENPERVSESAKKRRERIKEELLNGYGHYCSCCGETHSAFLTLEHLNGDGAEHRRRLNKDSMTIYRDVIKRGFPSEYTILCMNCNFSKRFNKECPHVNKLSDKQKIDQLVEALEKATDQLEKAVGGERIDTKAVNQILKRQALSNAKGCIDPAA